MVRTNRRRGNNYVEIEYVSYYEQSSLDTRCVRVCGWVRVFVECRYYASVITGLRLFEMFSPHGLAEYI